MNRTLVISDIHGCNASFNELLQTIGYNSGQDKLILLGDFVDRGPNSKEVVEQVIEMVEAGQAIALRGNHDQRFLEVMANEANEHATQRFFEYGGHQTLSSYCSETLLWNGSYDERRLEAARAYIQDTFGHHLDFINQLPYYYEDEHHIYVHAGINPEYTNWKEQPLLDFLWIRDPFYSKPTIVEKTVVFGHTRAINMHDTAHIWFGGDKIGIDGGCAYGMQLNCLEILEGKEYRTYHVSSVESKS
ncbi:metallophosphoesterase family protein [Paenibacillus sp. UNC451MF]|uniref:metallophosphoesterase family protein n=1 Tax=Paenibacillus sp. UNC451MF TaxID=1449063 RepID=UPI00048AC10E|nr:metallophosphoesterase family protein [Paenibacillus sp. UNC451MF]